MEKFDFIDSKFRFAILAAKRAKQLVAGAKRKTDSHAENPLTIAMQEIYQGKVKYRILEEDEQFMYNEESSSMLLDSEEEEQPNHNIEEYMFGDKKAGKYEEREDRDEDSFDEGLEDKYEEDDDSDSSDDDEDS